MARANIASSEILTRLRQAIVLLSEEVERSLSAANHDCAQIIDWLQHQQLPQLRRSTARQEQRYSEARIVYLAAKHQGGRSGPQPHEDAERTYRKAKLQLEALQEQLQIISMTLTRLPRELEQPLAAVRRSGSRIAEYAQAAVARLDAMHDDLERYHGGTG